MTKLFFAALACALVLGCRNKSADEKNLPAGVGIILANRDTTVRPADDLFTYVNGSWVSRTVIPADRGIWGAFNELRERNTRIALDVLQKAAASQDYLEGTDQRKAADFYSVGMDSARAEKVGITPLKALLEKTDKLAGKADVQEFLAQEDLMGGHAFFRFDVEPDSKNSQKMAVYLGSGGLGLPERDYYLKQDAKSKETRDKYRKHIVDMLVLTGSDPVKATKMADGILTVETRLAGATLTKEDRRDPARKYNKKSVGDLGQLMTSLSWPAYFKVLGVKEDSIIVEEPAFMKECDKIISGNSLDDVKAYLRWTFTRDAAPFLNHAVVQESFEFNTHYLLGVDRMRPRWKRVLETTETHMGDAIGRLYVAEVFPPEAKKKALEMVDNIRFAFADRIKQLDWMSDSTKKMALEKLSKITVKIGYPDKWKNYSGLAISTESNVSYYDNVLNASKYRVQERINKLGKPVDKTEWGMTPQTVNASYNAVFNEIVFPAGILQPPFYDYRADEAVNYGGIGGGIGHEISHGFDDEGSQFDASGNLRNWWSTEDLRKFKAKGKALADQFSRYQPLPGLFVQGQFTLGENIGDLGGLNVALAGLHRYLRENNITPPTIDGLTSDQRFFMSWATIWRAKYRDESLRTQVLTNEHAPGMYRANGPPSNMPEFYAAFGLKPGDKMYRDDKDRVKIW